MKLLITGAKGQLGTELCRQLKEGKSSLGSLPKDLLGATVIPVDLDDADLSCKEEALQLLAAHRPDAVINCAAFTAVDAAETQQAEAFRGNALAARNVAMACHAHGAKLVHVSTDYVFSGLLERPYIEGDPTGPLTVYGATKCMGEDYVQRCCPRSFVVRTSWLYGRTGGNFVKTILRLAKEREEIRVVSDQRGNPTNAEDLAYHLLKIAASDEFGLYHCTGTGVCTWHDFACAIVRLAGKTTKVLPCTTAEYPTPAQRPANSALAHHMLAATVGDEMRPWEEALENYLKEMGD